MELRKATRGEIWARCCFYGEAGRGKTYTALATAHHLADLYGYKREEIAVIDTEVVESVERTDAGQGSAEKYTGRPCNCNRCHKEGLVFGGFLTILLKRDQCGPDSMQQAMKLCQNAGIKILIIDGITPEWRAIVKMADQIGKREGWQIARPMHDAFEDAIERYPGHVLVTMRAKKGNQYNDGETTPDQDSNVLHRYDIGIFVEDSTIKVVKTRDDRLERWTQRHAGADLAMALKTWCDDPRAAQAAEERKEKPQQAAPPAAPALAAMAAAGDPAILAAKGAAFAACKALGAYKEADGKPFRSGESNHRWTACLQAQTAEAWRSLMDWAQGALKKAQHEDSEQHLTPGDIAEGNGTQQQPAEADSVALPSGESFAVPPEFA